tara:strand:+ start:888 stop:1889 length:1002 start_codon:yes stop_codon:yes gene_type:complete
MVLAYRTLGQHLCFEGDRQVDTPVNLVVFASRESFITITNTLSCALRAIPEGSRVDVLINGIKELAYQTYHWATRNMPANRQLKTWNIPVGDKGNAWNQHIHKIWQGDMNTIYIDGYVRVTKDAISALSRTLACRASSLGTSGLPTIGASAGKLRRKMQKEGGFHGNLCSIKSVALEQIRNRNIRIPLGMYRVDGLMGAFLSFGLDNTLHTWDPFRFIPHTIGASWVCDDKKWYHIRNIFAWKNRRDRQARGDIENAAIKYHLTELKCLPEALPENISSLVSVWSHSNPIDAYTLTDQSSRHRNAMAFINNYVPPAPSECTPCQISHLHEAIT